MSQIFVAASRMMMASPEAIYAVLSDYREGHPAILPRPYFTGLTVEQGGQGAGTVFQTQMTVYGTQRSFHMTVTEPEPGRILVETDETAGVVTKFILEPLKGPLVRVTIASGFRPSSGLEGLVERLVNPLVIRRIYGKELKLIEEHVLRQHTA